MLGWEFWTIALIIGLPICVLVLSEVQLRLRRRESPLAAPMNRIRILLLPLVGLLLLLTQAAQVPTDNSGVRIVATFVGIGVVTSTLGLLDAVLFGNARQGTWRERLPSIFVDLGRLILIVAGAAVVASTVWGFESAVCSPRSVSARSSSASPCRAPSAAWCRVCCCCSSSRSPSATP